MNLKKGINAVLGRFGYRIQRMGAEPAVFGVDPMRDMRVLSTAGDQPVIFDVGANVGQSIDNFRRHFRSPVIHSFEPSPKAFAELQSHAASIPGVTLNNLALGARPGEASFFESEAGTPMSSLLQPGTECWGGGGVRETLQVRVSSVDEYCRQRGIGQIDILKIDTQGYDFEVIKGAKAMIRNRAIHLIHMEIIFCDMYKGLPRMDEIYAFLADRGYELVTFYPFCYWGNKASWTEGLFMHPEYRRMA
ncbi:MAG TPA: FkbM family methyltransferase [Nevskiales bacterium]|nr:FkbM family methyltransferase [Nevskiales bacterium]